MSDIEFTRSHRASGDDQMHRLLRELIDDRTKGVPLGTTPFELRTIGELDWSLRDGDVPFPVLVANHRALNHNIERMQRYCDEHGVVLAPHGKTSMAPQIFARQIAAGAWGLTAATIEQLAVYVRYGFNRILLANQVAGEGNLRALGRLLETRPDIDLTMFVDSPASLHDLEDLAKRYQLNRPIKVLIEVGYLSGRTGTRSVTQVQRVLATLNETQHVQLMGVAAFEGLLPTEQDRHKADAMDLLENTAAVVDELISRELLPERFIVTAGGSAVFDLVVKAFANRWPNRATVILRSGCYVTQDHGLYCASSPLAHDDDPLEQALELWTYVQSRPESNLAYAAFGRRDAPFDSGYPKAIACLRRGEAVRRPVTGIIVEELNDQHARLRLNDGIDLEVGDTIIFGIAHPCSAFDRWRLVMEVDDDDRVIGGLRTFF